MTSTLDKKDTPTTPAAAPVAAAPVTAAAPISTPVAKAAEKPAAKTAPKAVVAAPVKAAVPAKPKAVAKPKVVAKDAKTPKASPAAKKAVTKPVAKPKAAPVTAVAPAPAPAKPKVEAVKKVKDSKPKKAAEPEVKAKKAKLVRDSFTIPKDEYDVLADLKQRAHLLAHSPKKSEILRAGVRLLAGLGQDAFLKALKAIPSIKTGRPAAEKPAVVAAPKKAGKA